MTSSDSPPPAYTPMAQPPPLPPRQPEPEPAPGPSMLAMASGDPRSSSQQSLTPAHGADDFRRTLLLVYLHGFMGNETSFQSFPAHLHNILTITMAESHVVHTKVYPRYRSRNTLDVARDDFSNWLSPHESPTTDVVLLGHSMGGLLAADIALAFRHHIVGVINFDVPFLGMHPGIVKAGLGTIFNPGPSPEPSPTAIEPASASPGRINTLLNPTPSDPNFNPNFPNDIHLPVRKGWENTFHFLNKHSKDLMTAGKRLVKSHFEFGGAMADYPQLKARYARIRALEEEDEEQRRSAAPGYTHPPRIRFVNYYTASTGRPKKPKSPKSPSPSRPASRGLESLASGSTAVASTSQLDLTHDSHAIGPKSPRISVDEYRDDDIVPVSPDEPLSAVDPIPLRQTPEEHPSVSIASPPMSKIPDEVHVPAPELPGIPPIPQEPPFVDISLFTDKSARKAAEKAHERALKDYQRAVKSRNKVIKERTKIQEKWDKQQHQQQKQKQKQKDEEQRDRQASTAQPDNHADTGAQEAEASTHRSPTSTNTIHDAQSPQSVAAVQDYFGSLDLSVGTGTGTGTAAQAVIPTETETESRVDPSAGPRIEQPQPAPYTTYEFSRSAILAQQTPASDTTPSASTPAASTYAPSTSTSTFTSQHRPESKTLKPLKPKARKFCLLPPKSGSGVADPTWVRVFMQDMDEVTAHTSLFFMSGVYERLVGDVAARVEEWVREAESVRVVGEWAVWEGGGVD